MGSDSTPVADSGGILRGRRKPIAWMAALALAIAAAAKLLPHADAQNAAFTTTRIARLEEPWAMTFLPDGRVLVTEKRGALKIVSAEGGRIADVTGVPQVAYGGQGGFGDVVLHPRFADNALVYVSFAEPGRGGEAGAAVARAKLALDSSGGGKLEGLEVIWRQVPKVGGQGHYGHRIAFAPDGHLYISSGERQKFDPAQDMNGNLGKIVRLNDDGSVPADNPFASGKSAPSAAAASAGEGVSAQIWSLGHRNPLGLAFDPQGRLWNVEMGPRGGDELNLVERGANYGWPIVSNGDHYSGQPIPDHPTRPEFHAPAVFWNPVISPSSLMFYSGSEFPEWRGNAFIGGLSSQSLVRIEFQGASAREAERFAMGAEIRGVRQGPDGAIWLLQDGRDGRLLRLTNPR
jgi:glucose/arabinose dehydrogenase